MVTHFKVKDLQKKAIIKLSELVNSSEPQIFKESIFPKIFDETAMEGYTEATESYTSMFENSKKYNAIMSVLCNAIYRDLRAQNRI